MHLVDCTGARGAGKKACQRINQCVVRDVWKEGSARLMSYLDSATLDDLCKMAQEKGVERTIDKHLMYYI